MPKLRMRPFCLRPDGDRCGNLEVSVNAETSSAKIIQKLTFLFTDWLLF